MNQGMKPFIRLGVFLAVFVAVVVFLYFLMEAQNFNFGYVSTVRPD
ncbi:hypothetical protein [Desulfurispira natronophila]|uniref:Uncharacterized protein n=1 Tax=Desulfurispira natronophila TaxID=682562 RepID=A0A7W7Y4K3_9BACT|nr:hypothetical protein [Desulfurispira natronophila]MBB5021919.1 hypothetical protein [Desulfurispira natronophila]